MVADKIPCYIINKNTMATVSFSVEIPDQVSDSYSTNFGSQSTKGRSTPFKTYNNSGPRSISFTVTMALDYRRDLQNTVEALRTMLKPVNSGYILAPRVQVRIGDFLNIEAVPVGFDVVWRGGYKDNMFRLCDCSFSFEQVEDKGTFAKNLGSNYQPVQAALKKTVQAVSAKSYSSVSTYDGVSVPEKQVQPEISRVGKAYYIQTPEMTQYLYENGVSERTSEEIKSLTGIDGSTLSDLKPGDKISLEQSFDCYSSSKEAMTVGASSIGEVLRGTYTIFSKYRDAIQVIGSDSMSGEENAVWINPF